MSIRKKLLAVAVLPLIATALLVAVIFSAQSLRANNAASADDAYAQRRILTDTAIAVGTERIDTVRGRDGVMARGHVDALFDDLEQFSPEVESSLSRAAAFVDAARFGPEAQATANYNAATSDLLAAADAIEVSFPSVDTSANSKVVQDMARVIDSTDRAWIYFAELGSGALDGREITEAATLFSLAEAARQQTRNAGTGDTAEVVGTTIRVTDAMSDYQRSAVDSLLSSNFRVVTPEEGLAAASDYRDRWLPAYERSSANLTFEISNNRTEARRYQLLAAVGGALAILLIGLFALIVKRSISNPLEELLDGTDLLVGESIPEMIAEMRKLEPEDHLSEPEFLPNRSGDEIGDIISSFNDLSRTAHRLAVEHAQLRHNTHLTLFDFGVRQARSLDRLIQGLNSLVIDEQNIAMLARLGELDHLASSVRRNAQSMVVLGGDYDERPWSTPTALERVVRSAVAHVEEYDRVDHARINPAFVRGSAASDLQHILAELAENGLIYSEATARVSIDGFWNDEFYVLVVSDSGRGMSAAEISVNMVRIREMPRFDQEPATRLGLAVVGQLARRHGIEVLITSKDVGINVVVTLPPSIATKTDEVEVPPSLAGAPEPRAPRVAYPPPVGPKERVQRSETTQKSAFGEPEELEDALSEVAANGQSFALRGPVSPAIAEAIQALRGSGD